GSARSSGGGRGGTSGAGSGKGRSAGTGSSGAGSGRGRGTATGRSGGPASGRAGSARSGKSGGGKSASGKSGGRGGPAGARGGAGRKGTAAASPPTANLLVALTAWLFRVIAMTWLLVAGVVGGIVRRFGRNARDLHPDHKRDGLGLVFFGLAIIFAAAVWARMHNPAFEGIYTLTSSAMGEGAFTVPIILALVGIRFMRHPDRNEALPPAEIGWTALLVGVLGLLHIAKGVPTLSHQGGGWPAIRTAGGLVGMAASWPLDKGLTAWVATPLLGLVAAYGLLVVTGTPVREVPRRMRELRALFGYEIPDDWDDQDFEEDDDMPLEGGKRRGEINRGAIRLKGTLEPGDQRKPYDPQVLVT